MFVQWKYILASLGVWKGVEQAFKARDKTNAALTHWDLESKDV